MLNKYAKSKAVTTQLNINAIFCRLRLLFSLKYKWIANAGENVPRITDFTNALVSQAKFKQIAVSGIP